MGLHQVRVKVNVITPMGYLHPSLADLIGFQRVPGHHTGKHLAFAFMHVLEHLEILPKVCISYHDNSILM